VKLLGTIALALGVAGGYVGARQILAREDLAERVPEPVRPVVGAIRARLLLARQRARTVIAEYQRERADAEAELMRDYLARVRRPPAAGASGRPRPGA